MDATSAAVSAFYGLLGGVIWWAYPPQPRGLTAVEKRLVTGAIVGLLANVGLGVSPYNSTGVFELVGSGFGGIASLVAVSPTLAKHLNTPSDGSAEDKESAKTQGQSGTAKLSVSFEKRKAFVPAHSATITVDFASQEKDTGYHVSLTPNWITSVGLVSKRVDGFTVEFGTHPTKDSELDYAVIR